jgi:hypothetical protein
MGAIKGVLKEELVNSLSLLKWYQDEAEKLKGALVKKKIAGRVYYYRARRQKGKVKFHYLGPGSSLIKKAHRERRESLAKYKKMIARVKNQIKFLKRALRGKETV